MAELWLTTEKLDVIIPDGFTGRSCFAKQCRKGEKSNIIAK